MRSEFSIEAEHLPSISAASTGDGRTVETMVAPVFATHTAVRGRRDLSSVIFKDWRATSTQSSGWACVVTNDFDSDRTIPYQLHSGSPSSGSAWVHHSSSHPSRAGLATPTGRQALSRSTMCVSMMHWCSTGSPRSRLSIICAIFAPIASDG